MRASRSDSADPLKARASHLSVLKELAPFVWQQDRPDLKVRVVLAFIALIAAKLVTVATPLAYKGAVDALTGGGRVVGDGTLPGATIIIVPMAMILAYGLGRVMMMVFNQIRDVLFVKVGQNAVRALARRSFAHMHRLSLRFHLARRTGGLSRVIDRGTKAVELVIRMGIMNTVPTLIELAMLTAMLVYMVGWSFVVIILITVAVYVAFTVKASEWRLAIRRDLNEADTEAGAKAVDSLLNFETVKYFGNEGLETKRFDRSMQDYERAAIKTYLSLGVLNSGQAFLFTSGLTICMLLAAHGVANGELTVGDFVMVNALLLQLYQPLHFMGTVYREIRQALVDLENMFALLGDNPEIIDKPGAKDLQISDGEVEFNNVFFSYDPDRPILKDVSFKVPAGKMVAIVGPSGAGKSTISRILFRFYEVASGEVLIDGQNIADITQASLRAAIGMVPQDTVLFNETIFYNIQYGRPDADRGEVIAAARMAQIDEFINTLPEGYDTMVGERGLKLSGGEKQRVAIARTILKAPPILMLDEATSALDSHTEREIQSALEKVAENRTTLVIAHRLSTVVLADEILVLEKGVVEERGTHSELIASGGIYASMWARQREADEARERLASVLSDVQTPAQQEPPPQNKVSVE